MNLHRRPFLGAGAAVCAALLAIAPVSAQAQAPADSGRIGLLAAVRDAIRLGPNNQLQQRQLQASEAAVMQAEGQFDTIYSASAARQRDSRPLRADEVQQLQAAGLAGIVQQDSDTNTVQAGAQRTLVNGLGLGASLSTTATADSAAQLTNLPTQTLGRITFTVRVPLLRNRGRESTGAALDAAAAEHRAAYQDLVQTNAQTVLGTTLAYWDYLARQRRLRIAQDAERRAAALLEEVDKLVRADQVARAELELLNASRAEKSASRLQAEQAFDEARRALARAIGLDAAASLRLGEPADDFPTYQGEDLSDRALPASLREAALARRADIAAGREREAAAQFRVVAARNNLRPQVDLNLNLGYVTLAEGGGAGNLGLLSWKQRVGPTFSATLSMQLPHRNVAAEGILLAQSAAQEAATIRLRELEANVAGTVAVRIEALRRAARQLAEGAAAVRRYATTLENERTKRRLGQATLIDVLNVQDRYENALSLQVQLQQAYAVAIAQLRFELGTLVRDAGGVFDVQADDLTTPRFAATP